MEDDTAPRQGEHATGSKRSEWGRRFAAAWSALNDTPAMADLYWTVGRTDESGPPHAKVLAGRERLRGAHRIGLLSGSFNPLTHAHVALAESARHTSGLDLIAWTIAARTIDKESVVRATVADRLAQLAAYASWTQRDAVLLVNRGLYLEQAEALRELAGVTSDVAIVVGFDKLVQILDPRYYVDRDVTLDELFAQARLLVAPRQNDDEAALQSLLAQPENVTYAPRVTHIDLAPRYRSDSSTEVRRTLSEGRKSLKTIRPLVPPEGYALARLGPYNKEAGEVHDAYGERVRQLDALVRTGGNERLN